MPVDPTNEIGALARIERMRATGEARAVRLRANISARTIAKNLNVSVNSVLRWEEGLSRPRPTVALAWLRLLDRITAELGPAVPEEPEPELATAAGGGP